MTTDYLTPCPCEKCKRGEHCYYCLHGNPGSHYRFHPMTDKPVLAWFATCFPQYRRGEKIVIPEQGRAT